MLRKPFVYFSDAIVTPTTSTAIIARAAAQHGGTPVLPVQDLWAKAALSVSRQAALFRHQGYKGEAWHRWLSDTVDLVADGVQFDAEASRAPFRAELMAALGRPATYYVPDNTRRFLALLTQHGIGWGIVANANHMYQAVLKMLQLAPPGPVVVAAGPTLFKPLPKMWARAAARAPAQSRHDIWFVGAASHPCDNMAYNSAIRCALVAPHLPQPDPVSQHFRVRSLDDLREPLLGAPSPAALPEFESLDEPIPFDDGTDVVLRGSSAPRAAVLPRDDGEPSLASFKKRTAV